MPEDCPVLIYKTIMKMQLSATKFIVMRYRNDELGTTTDSLGAVAPWPLPDALTDSFSAERTTNP